MKNFGLLSLYILFLLSLTLQMDAQRERGRDSSQYNSGPSSAIQPEDLDFSQGTASIPDLATFEALSYQGTDVGRDEYLANIEFVKFIIINVHASKPTVYFMNTKNERAHPRFMGKIGLGGMGRGRGRGGPGGNSNMVRGAINFMPRLATPNGESGLYYFDFQPNDSHSFKDIRAIRDVLVSKAPFLKGRVAFHPLRGNLDLYEQEKDLYENSDVAVHLDEDLFQNIAFLPMNPAVSYGRLRIMDNDSRPAPRDILICESLPNQMPRVAGVITAERQTPLSHVNLRAVQDKVPNAYVQGALQRKDIHSFIGKLVKYEVTSRGFSLHEASQAEVDQHFEHLRPTKGQTPVRDLTITSILPLNSINFKQSSGVGVKAANLATMRGFDLPEGTVPDGFAVPFYFYVEFMKHNGFDKEVDALVNRSEVDQEQLESKLKTFRKSVKEGSMPEWMMSALENVQKTFPDGAAIRCRSSTNNEDLPSFSGAGLYDSFTHNAEEGHLAKSIKQVYASLWNYRAFEEREFYRIDHTLSAMGVLLHQNFQDEKSNGVAVTDDVLYESQGNYYLNIQKGEDLVTNPDEASSPEEVLLGWWAEDGYQVVRQSTQVSQGGQLLAEKHLKELRDHLAVIHSEFESLYDIQTGETFAMEIEFKVTKDDQLVIKQARPWVF